MEGGRRGREGGEGERVGGWREGWREGGKEREKQGITRYVA